MAITLKLIHAYEELDAIEAETDPVKKTIMLQKYGSVSPLNFILSLNFNHEIKLDIPEGMPPMNPKDMGHYSHPDFAGLLSANIARLRHCMAGGDLKKFQKERQFMDVILNCPLKDAEIVCSAKDHALEELYPSITAEFVAAVFPAYVKG